MKFSSIATDVDRLRVYILNRSFQFSTPSNMRVVLQSGDLLGTEFVLGRGMLGIELMRDIVYDMSRYELIFERKY